MHVCVWHAHTWLMMVNCKGNGTQCCCIAVSWNRMCVCVCVVNAVFSPSEFVVDCRKFVDSNLLGLTVAALSSYDPHMRAAASRCWRPLLTAGGARFRGSWWRGLRSLAGRFPEELKALPRDSDTEPKSCLLLAGRGRCHRSSWVLSPGW